MRPPRNALWGTPDTITVTKTTRSSEFSIKPRTRTLLPVLSRQLASPRDHRGAQKYWILAVSRRATKSIPRKEKLSRRGPFFSGRRQYHKAYRVNFFSMEIIVNAYFCEKALASNIGYDRDKEYPFKLRDLPTERLMTRLSRTSLYDHACD